MFVTKLSKLDESDTIKKGLYLGEYFQLTIILYFYNSK